MYIKFLTVNPVTPVFSNDRLSLSSPVAGSMKKYAPEVALKYMKRKLRDFNQILLCKVIESENVCFVSVF